MPEQKSELHFKRPFRTTWTDDKGEGWLVSADLVFDERGLRFTRLEISPAKRAASLGVKPPPPPSITTRVLQRLPLQKWTAEFAAAKSEQLQRHAASAPWAALPV